MIGLQTRFHQLLLKKIEERAGDARDQLEKGVPQDFPSYRQSVGYLQALRDVLADAQTIEKQITE